MVNLIKKFNVSSQVTNKKRIGFVFSGTFLPYDKVIPSTRLRVYDVIRAFNNSDRFTLEVYRPWRKYDAVIFQKTFDEKAFRLALRLKKTTKIVLDINVNYFDHTWMKKGELNQNKNICRFMTLTDHLLVSTNYLKQYILPLHSTTPITVIEENIPDKYLLAKPPQVINQHVTFVYNGYSIKTKDLQLLQHVLTRLANIFDVSYLFVCEKKPSISFTGVQTKFIKHSYKINEEHLALGQICLAPRDLNDSYNLGHSFTKIGLPMAVGIPVVASPIPSYTGSPAILVNDFGDAWEYEITKLITDRSYYNEIAARGRTYCAKNYSIKIIAEKYNDLFSSLAD
jgi:glycosyltransferase involved in cell wall biosynthesis